MTTTLNAIRSAVYKMIGPKKEAAFRDFISKIGDGQTPPDDAFDLWASLGLNRAKIMEYVVLYRERKEYARLLAEVPAREAKRANLQAGWRRLAAAVNDAKSVNERLAAEAAERKAADALRQFGSGREGRESGLARGRLLASCDDRLHAKAREVQTPLAELRAATNLDARLQVDAKQAKAEIASCEARLATLAKSSSKSVESSLERVEQKARAADLRAIVAQFDAATSKAEKAKRQIATIEREVEAIMAEQMMEPKNFRIV